jgi:large subunit ribosomal protein L28
MGMKCSNCAKGVMYGHNVSHSKRRTPRVFKPNLHSARINTGNGFVKLKLCTKCLRVFKRAEKIAAEAAVVSSSASNAASQATA